MSEDNNTTTDERKDFRSAICIAPPIELCGQIQQWRKNHDSAYNRWMPHINLIFPFVRLEQFEAKLPQLQEAMLRIPSFKIRFSDFSYFKHGKGKCVLWLKPETDTPLAIQEVQATLEANLPGFNEQSTKSEAGFTPHLTIGQFPSHIIEKQIASFRADFTPIEYQLTEIQMINRVGDTPFVVIHNLKLGPPN